MFQKNVTGKGRVESCDDEGSFNDAASMVSDFSEVCIKTQIFRERFKKKKGKKN